GGSGARVRRHEDQRHAEGADHERQQRREPQGRALQESRRRGERETASEQRQRAVAWAREASVEDTERCLSGGAGHRADGCAGRERQAVIEGQEERDRTRRERESDEPAADSRSPATPGHADRADQRGCEHELERQTVHACRAYRDRPATGRWKRTTTCYRNLGVDWAPGTVKSKVAPRRSAESHPT